MSIGCVNYHFAKCLAKHSGKSCSACKVSGFAYLITKPRTVKHLIKTNNERCRFVNVTSTTNN